MNNFARYGSNLDLEQQAIICQANVNSHFEHPAPGDTIEAIKASAMVFCLIYCTAAAGAILIVGGIAVAEAFPAVVLGGTAGGLGDAASQYVSKGSIDPAEVGFMTVLGAVTGGLVPAEATLAERAVIQFMSQAGVSAAWSATSQHKIEPKINGEAGFWGAFCAVFEGTIASLLCAVGTGVIQGEGAKH
jgi:hypothetical protein